MEREAFEERVRELIGQGDLAGAATQALRGLGPLVLRYLRSLLRDEAAASEAFSQFAENLWKGLPAFRREATLRTWVFRLAYHAALNLKDDAFRRRGRRLATGEASEDRRGGADEDGGARRAAARGARAPAPDPHRGGPVAPRPARRPGSSWAEIAGVLSAEGKPVEPAALMKRFERLKDKLGRLAREQGLVE